MMPRRNLVRSFMVLAASLAVTAAVVPGYRASGQEDVIRKGPGVTAVRRLSDWFPGIRGTQRRHGRLRARRRASPAAWRSSSAAHTATSRRGT